MRATLASREAGLKSAAQRRFQQASESLRPPTPYVPPLLSSLQNQGDSCWSHIMEVATENGPRQNCTIYIKLLDLVNSCDFSHSL